MDKKIISLNGAKHPYISTVLSGCVILSLQFFTACAKGPSPAQLKDLDNAKVSANAAEKELSELEGELGRLKNDLDKEKSSLSENEADKERLKGSK